MQDFDFIVYCVVESHLQIAEVRRTQVQNKFTSQEYQSFQYQTYDQRKRLVTDDALACERRKLQTKLETRQVSEAHVHVRVRSCNNFYAGTFRRLLLQTTFHDETAGNESKIKTLYMLLLLLHCSMGISVFVTLLN